jgi:hypothetical protein
MSDEDFKRFLETALQSCRAIVKPGASLCICLSSSWQREFQNALESAGFNVRCHIIRAKNTFAWGSVATNSSMSQFSMRGGFLGLGWPSAPACPWRAQWARDLRTAGFLFGPLVFVRHARRVRVS